MNKQEILERLREDHYQKYLSGHNYPLHHVDFTSIVLDILDMSWDDLCHDLQKDCAKRIKEKWE